MSHKKGDTVRIQTQEWIGVQEKKDVEGSPAIWRDGCEPFVKDMFCYAGKIATIMGVDKEHQFYDLDIDDGKYAWEDYMFDPDYRPEDELLSAEDAIHAMVDNGETLYDENGHDYRWVKEYAHFSKSTGHEFTEGAVYCFDNLYRRHAKRTRPMTTEEVAAWAVSEESLGWMIRLTHGKDYPPIPRMWLFPREVSYILISEHYQRAKLLPDLSGIDQSTIQGFEVGVEE